MKNDVYEMQAEICKALGHPVRLKILDLIGEQEKNHSELCQELDLPKANVSQHLNVLKDAGVILVRKEGLFLHYKLALVEVKKACSLIREILLQQIAHHEARQAFVKKELKRSRRNA